MSKRILLADDSRTIQQVVKMCLADEVVETAADAAGALALARQVSPDLILVDSRLPGEDGYAFGRTLQQESATATVPRVLLYSAFGTVDEAAASAAGYGAWCPKPFDSEMLNAAVEQAMQAAAATQPLPVSEPEPELDLELEPEAEKVSSEEEAPMLADLAAEEEPFSFGAPEGGEGEAEGLGEAAVPPAVEATPEPTDEVWSDLTFAAEDLAAEPSATETAVASATEPEAAFEFEMEGESPAEEAFEFESEAAPAEQVGEFTLPADEESFAPEALEAETPQELPPLTEKPTLAEEPAVEESVTAAPQFEESPSFAAPEPEVEAEPAVEEPSPMGAGDEVLELSETDILVVEDLAWQTEAPESRVEEAVSHAIEAEDEVVTEAPSVPADFSQVVEAETETETEIEEAPPEPVSVPQPEIAVPEPSFNGIEPVAMAETPPAAAPPQQSTADLEKQLQQLPEAELAALLERVAKPMLERIAWEVVPDLAESLIRDEIRRIRETVS